MYLFLSYFRTKYIVFDVLSALIFLIKNLSGAFKLIPVLGTTSGLRGRFWKLFLFLALLFYHLHTSPQFSSLFVASIPSLVKSLPHVLALFNLSIPTVLPLSLLPFIMSHLYLLSSPFPCLPTLLLSICPFF